MGLVVEQDKGIIYLPVKYHDKREDRIFLSVKGHPSSKYYSHEIPRNVRPQIMSALHIPSPWAFQRTKQKPESCFPTTSPLEKIMRPAHPPRRRKHFPSDRGFSEGGSKVLLELLELHCHRCRSVALAPFRACLWEGRMGGWGCKDWGVWVPLGWGVV